MDIDSNSDDNIFGKVLTNNRLSFMVIPHARLTMLFEDPQSMQW